MTVQAAQGSDGIGYPLHVDSSIFLVNYFSSSYVMCQKSFVGVAYVAGHMKYGPSPDIRYDDECNDRTFDGKGLELGRMSWSGYSEHEALGR